MIATIVIVAFSAILISVVSVVDRKHPNRIRRNPIA